MFILEYFVHEGDEMFLHLFFLSKLQRRNISRFRSCGLLLRSFLHGLLNGKGAVQLLSVSFISPSSIIFKKALSWMEGEILLSFLVCLNTLHPKCSGSQALSASWVLQSNGTCIPQCFCFMLKILGHGSNAVGHPLTVAFVNRVLTAGVLWMSPKHIFPTMTHPRSSF